jgi:hypothetical protein
MLPRIDWTREDRWPFGGRQFTFIAGAVRIVGRHLHGREWSGEEFDPGFFAESLPALPPHKPERVTQAHHHALLLLRKFRPELGSIDDVESLTDEHWRQAFELRNTEYLTRWTACRNRVQKAREEIRRLCETEVLTGAIRDERTGDFNGIPHERWRTERFREWFAKSQVGFGEVSPSPLGSRSDHGYLFIETAGLAKFESIVAPAPAESGYISPYMQLMFDVIREFRITEDHQSKRDLILEYIEEEWVRRGFPDSNKLRESMATMVRDPLAQSGNIDRARAKALRG